MTKNSPTKFQCMYGKLNENEIPTSQDASIILNFNVIGNYNEPHERTCNNSNENVF